MPKSRINADKLRRFRNELSVATLLADVLDLPTKISEGYLRFRCPACGEFNTATNPKTNLARCFRCEKNFNTIDLVMIVHRVNFLEAVDFLDDLLGP